SGGRGGATTGSGGSSSTAGTTGAGGATGVGGATGTAGTGGGTVVDQIQVAARCQPEMSAQEIKVTFEILNPGSVTKQLSDIKVRYYFSLTTPLPPTVYIDFAQKVPKEMVTSTVTTSYVELGFAPGTGSLAAFDNLIGTDQIQLRLGNYSTTTWNTSQDDDYSYKSCAGVTNTMAYADRTTMPGYYQGQLAWGSEPAQ
ncbi:MAG TPA: cellulose binding domain-containing protein, partial [Polyangia bacterium]